MDRTENNKKTKVMNPTRGLNTTSGWVHFF
jgi:hypothetical protein